jgi:hypothetical protein
MIPRVKLEIWKELHIILLLERVHGLYQLSVPRISSLMPPG